MNPGTRISRCLPRCYEMVFWYTVWMSSSRSIAVRVLRLRVKDKHAAWLCGLAREVNTVFNYCNELSVKVAAFTDEALPPIEAERFYRDLEPMLARAQRARHRNRSRAIHAKIANRRKDFLQ